MARSINVSRLHSQDTITSPLNTTQCMSEGHDSRKRSRAQREETRLVHEGFSTFPGEHSCLSAPQAPNPKRRQNNNKAQRKTQEPDSEDTFQAPPALEPALPMGTWQRPRLSDRFQVSQAVLGTGQYGTVRECTDLVTGEVLACKTVQRRSSECTSTGEAHRTTVQAGEGQGGGWVEDHEPEELMSEVQMMQRVSAHPNVVQIRELFEDQDDGQVHLVMDLCRGGKLFDEIVRRERFSESDAAHLFAEVAGAVAFCHSHGVVHRDLKPENLLLTKPLEPGVPLADLARQGPLVKLADFGLSTRMAPGEKLFGAVGSPFYIAPEVLTGEYDAKADVWSLGVILFVLLSGSPPFWGPTDPDVFQAILYERLDLSSAPWDRVSAGAKWLVRSCLDRNLARRPTAELILSHPWILHNLGSGDNVMGPINNLAERATLPVA